MRAFFDVMSDEMSVSLARIHRLKTRGCAVLAPKLGACGRN